MSHSAALVIYHGDCDDGFGAAWVIWSQYKDWDFFPGVYGAAPPDVAGRDVVLVDFSYKRPVLEAMARVASSIRVIDHHESSVRELSDPFDDPAFCSVEVVFDAAHSGAVLTWRAFRGDEPPPKLLEYIEARDLWDKDRFPYVDAVAMRLRSYPKDFTLWDRLMGWPIESLIHEGRPIHEWHVQRVCEAVRRWKQEPMFVRLGYASVPVMNTTVEFCSELAQALAALGYPFAAVFWHTSAGVTYSLRSQPAVYGEDGEVHEHAGSNVALVAEGYGGGGHAHAAGFRVAAPLPMEHGVFLS